MIIHPSFIIIEKIGSKNPPLKDVQRSSVELRMVFETERKSLSQKQLLFARAGAERGTSDF